MDGKGVCNGLEVVAVYSGQVAVVADGKNTAQHIRCPSISTNPSGEGRSFCKAHVDF